MRVLHFCHRPGFVRNRVIQAGLEANGVEVAPVPFSALSSGGGGWRLRPVDLIRRAVGGGRADIILLGFLNSVDLPVAWGLSRAWGVPLIVDMVVGKFAECLSVPGTPASLPFGYRGLAWTQDLLRFILGDRVLLETESMRRLFQPLFRVPESKCHVLRSGAEDWMFRPTSPRTDPEVTVFVGAGAKHHQGLDVVVRAAKLLEGAPGVAFEVVVGSVGPLGGGNMGEIRALHERLRPGRLRVHWGNIDYPEYARRLMAADIALGSFGTTVKASITVPLRVISALAAAKPVVTADGPGAREVLTHGETALLIPPGDPSALAESIRLLRDDPGLRRRLAANGHRLYEEQFTPKVIGAQLKEMLQGVLVGS